MVSSALASGNAKFVTCGTLLWYVVGTAVLVKIYCVTIDLAYVIPAIVSTRCDPIAFCALTFE